MRPLRVFLSSPGDVADERGLARRLLKEELPYDPLLRGRVTFDVISWDDPASPTPMPAALTPQDAVNRFGPRPSECDIVVVVLWSRLGTHLDVAAFGEKPGGGPYLSGTEWEFEDAWSAWNVKRRPEILIYRRTEEPKIGVKDPARAEKFRQYDLVEQFFERLRNPDSSLRGGWTPYDTSTGFKERLANDLKYLLRDRLDQLETKEAVSRTAPAWTGSPYPGLRPFGPEEVAIFFGRGRDVDALVTRLCDPMPRFLAVVGASGTGKSSFVRAGLMPRLKDGAIKGSQHWPVLLFTPGAYGDNPLLALASKLEPMLPTRTVKSPVEIAIALAAAPETLSDYADALLADRPSETALVLCIDQFEELFTLAGEKHRQGFIEFLAHTANNPRLRVLATVRADFLPQCAAEPALAAMLQTGTFVLGAPGPGALSDMIRKPAERAGLELEDGLVDEILRDAGAESGTLPLVAFCLEELYRQTAPEHCLTLDAYRALGGMRGAIARRTGAFLEQLRKRGGVDVDAALPRVFHALVHVDAAGKAARQRTYRDKLMAAPAPVPWLVEALIKERLLLAEDVGGRAVVALAHEALIQEWPALNEWLGHNRDRLRIGGLLSTISTMRGVLILGRFTPERKSVLDAVSDELRKRDYLPILFDFETPAGKDISETLSLLAHMARFVIADLTDAKNLAQELYTIVPNNPSLPVQPLILATEAEFAMFDAFSRYPWVLAPYRYHTLDQLISDFDKRVIGPLEAARATLEARGRVKPS